MVGIMKSRKKNYDNERTQLQMADLLIDVVPVVMQVLREEMRHGRGDKLTVPQFRVLAGIGRGITQNKILADKLGVSEAAISRMIDVLFLEKLINKGINKNDRRLAELSLTAEGRKLFNHIKSDARERLKGKMNLIKENDINLIITGLESLKNNINKLSLADVKE